RVVRPCRFHSRSPQTSTHDSRDETESVLHDEHECEHVGLRDRRSGTADQNDTGCHCGCYRANSGALASTICLSRLARVNITTSWREQWSASSSWCGTDVAHATRKRGATRTRPTTRAPAAP